MATRKPIKISEAARARQVLAQLVDYCVTLAETGRRPPSTYKPYVAFAKVIDAALAPKAAKVCNARAAALAELLEAVFHEIVDGTSLADGRARLLAASVAAGLDLELTDDDLRALVIERRSRVKGARDSIGGMGGPREAACELVARHSPALFQGVNAHRDPRNSGPAG